MAKKKSSARGSARLPARVRKADIDRLLGIPWPEIFEVSFEVGSGRTQGH